MCVTRPGWPFGIVVAGDDTAVILNGRREPTRTSQKGTTMAIGPVQLIALGFPDPNFHGEIIAELDRLRESDTVRVIDALAVYKDDAGDVEVMHLSNLSREEAIELGSVIGALIGLGEDGADGAEAGAAAGAELAAADGMNALGDVDGWDVLDDIPNGSAAALILVEHQWAVPLRDALVRAGGFRLADGFISPLDLVEVGLLTAAEAADLHALETAGAGART
jgi:uncharacterized membrane protein